MNRNDIKLHKSRFTLFLIVLNIFFLSLAACAQPSGQEGLGSVTVTPAPDAEVAEPLTPTSTPDSTPTSLPMQPAAPQPPTAIITGKIVELSDIPAYSGYPYVAVDNNIPSFTEEEYVTESFELYGDLDSLGRCTTVYASIGPDIMPTGERGSIGSVKPTGWHTVKYTCVDGLYLYNRCHLIGWQLTGENANTRNLITGTRYMNVDGMLPFENMVDDYIEETGNHVLYRVTPIFE